MEPKLPTPSGEVDLQKYWRLRGKLDSIRAAKSAVHENWVSTREQLQRAERRAERQKGRPEGRAVEMYEGGPTPAGGAAERVADEAVETLRAEMDRLKQTGDDLARRASTLGPLVARCETYLKSLDLLSGPRNQVDLPATPSKGRAA